jgi:hypothetical protein
MNREHEATNAAAAKSTDEYTSAKH